MSVITSSGLGLIVAIVVLFYMAFKGFHNVYVAVAAVTIMAIFSKLSVFDTLMDTMMGGAASYIKSYYLLFLGGAVLGAIYQCTGAGSAIADAMLKVFGPARANLAIMLFCYVAIMGGIQSFVAFFAVYPVAIRLYEKANINRAILPCVMTGGMWTIGHTSPWAPSVGNQVASDALGTKGSAGWLPGIIFVLVAGTLIVLYSNWAAKRLREKGKGFDSWEDLVEIKEEDLPHLIPSLIPLIAVFVFYNVVGLNVTLATWIGVLLGIVLFFRRKTLTQWKDELFQGASSGTTVAVNTALVVAIGTVIGTLPFYDWLIEKITTIQMNPYLVAVLATGIMAAVTGSASGALTIVFKLLGPMFVGYGEMGYNLGYIHRLAVQSVSCWDTLPQCGPLIGVLHVCKTNHHDAYIHVLMTTIVVPIIACYLIEMPICMLLGGI